MERTRALRMGIHVVAAASLAFAVLASSAVGAAEIDLANGTRYVDLVFPASTATGGVVYATAPDLVTGADVDLVLDVYEPTGDTAKRRPAIVWVHGGGFKAGGRSSLAMVASDYARRGYVTLSIDYRLDAGNRCQDVQSLRITDPAEVATERARCEEAIFAAQHDAQAAVRWIRANAKAYRVDPKKIAMGGSSAGAVTTVNVATNRDEPGAVGDERSQSSQVRAGLVASGCSYHPETIDDGDAPLYLLHAELDRPVPFACAQDLATRYEAAGLPVVTDFHLGEATHGLKLYRKYQAEVDAAWTDFLVQQLDLD